MEEIEITLEQEGNKEQEIDLISEGTLIYPSLEDLTVIPSGEKQTFNHLNSYGYDNVVVEAVLTEELNITPSTEEQAKEGMFNKVTVAGDTDLIAENIKSGVNIFGVEGEAVVSDTSKQAIIYSDYNENGIPTKAVVNETFIGSSIPNHCFYASAYINSALEDIVLPNTITTIGTNAFDSLTTLKNITGLDNVTTVNSRGFLGVNAITDLPKNLESVSSYSYNNCTGLVTKYFPESFYQISGNYAFGSCSGLTDVISYITYIGSNSVFYSCANLRSFRFKKAMTTSLPSTTFGYCSSLVAVIFDEGVPSLANVNAFNSTPIKNGAGYIYVPDDDVETVKTMTNWSSYADQIKPISELPEEFLI